MMSSSFLPFLMTGKCLFCLKTGGLPGELLSLSASVAPASALASSSVAEAGATMAFFSSSDNHHKGPLFCCFFFEGEAEEEEDEEEEEEEEDEDEDDVSGTGSSLGGLMTVARSLSLNAIGGTIKVGPGRSK